MRTLVKPNFELAEIYQQCLAGIGDAKLVLDLQVILPAFYAQADLYDSKASESRLYELPQNTAGNEDVILNGITKKQIKNLYSQYLVSQEKPARIYYDALIGMAPNGKCPYCGFGQASTLDHYLPKSKYPFFSILASNLVPSCKDCNTGKSAVVASVANDQSIHPYYDSGVFVDSQWLYATVEESEPPSVTFFVDPPLGWLEVSKQRAFKHFADFKLAKRFSIEAADEISTISDSFSESIENLDEQEVRRQLLRKSNAEFQKYKNSWKTALYQALASSDWYCRVGCRL